MKPHDDVFSLADVLLIAGLVAACGSPAAAPTPTPVPPTVAPAPPTAIMDPGTVITPQAETTPEPVGLRPDAPPYAVHGPYWVGYKPLVIGEGTDHPINAGLWYPALNPNGDPEEITYPMSWKIPSIPLDAEPVAYGHALLDAPVDESAAPYPLVVFSHGFGNSAPWYANLIEHYASRGFIVLAPDHTEQFDFEYGELWKASIDRPNDIKQTLDYAEQATASGGDLAGLIDMGHVAVAGHSYGGYTALAAAGAQYDLAGFNARCAALAPDDPNAFLCAPLVPHEADMAARAGLDPMPAGLWPSFGDPRVTAIIPMAGDSYLFDQAGLAKITVPMMAIGGTADTGTPYEWGSKPAYQYASSTKKALVTLVGAEHSIACASCETLRFLRETPLSGWICYDPVWDKDRGIDLINHFSTAFLLDTLKGDTEAAKALAPENVTFPRIRYETIGFAAAPSAILDDATIAKIEALVQEMMSRNQLPGFALGVVKDGQLAYAKGFGVSSLDDGEPVTPQTVFQWAETSMVPTAMAVLQLAEAGKIDLDAPITTYLPYFKMKDERYGDITVRQLLMQRSGVPDSSSLRADSGNTMADWEDFTPEFDDAAIKRWVCSLADQELLFAPGSSFEYSDQGYALLGAVIGAASGQSYEASMNANILKPLGMTHSTFLLDEVDKSLLAAPHVAAADKVVAGKVMPYHRPFAAANNLFSTIEDMAKLARASLNRGSLEGQRILPEGAVDQMWESNGQTPYADFAFGTAHPSKMMSEWGYGWFLGDVAGHRVASTVGGDYGYNGSVAVAPDSNLAVIAVGNGPLVEGYFANDMVTDVMDVLLEGLDEGSQ